LAPALQLGVQFGGALPSQFFNQTEGTAKVRAVLIRPEVCNGPDILTYGASYILEIFYHRQRHK
jgi:hypothetical protein